MKKITIEFAGEDGEVDRDVREVVAVKDIMCFLDSFEQLLRDKDKYSGETVNWGEVRRAYYQLKSEYDIPDHD